MLHKQNPFVSTRITAIETWLHLRLQFLLLFICSHLIGWSNVTHDSNLLFAVQSLCGMFFLFTAVELRFCISSEKREKSGQNMTFHSCKSTEICKLYLPSSEMFSRFTGTRIFAFSSHFLLLWVACCLKLPVEVLCVPESYG